MTFILDTSAYSAFNRGDPRLRKWFQAGSGIAIPLIVVGELRAGFALGGKRKENEALLQRFLDAPNVDTVTVSDATTRLFAEIYLKLRQSGKPIGTNDIWIAALALEHNLSVLTLDSDFSYIPDLMIADIYSTTK